MKGTILAALVAALSLTGCQVKPPKNPDDPNEVSGARQPYVIDAYMKQMSDDVISPAVAKREISEAQGQELMAMGARDYMNSVVVKNTPPDLVWMIGQAFYTAREWEKAQTFFERARKGDSTQDRKVNDALRIARCEAERGFVDSAIETARSTFSTPPAWKWPILYAVYLEIVPAAFRIRSDKALELAHLVEDAIKQHEAAVGSLSDPRTGEDFVARKHHIEQAWKLIAYLYETAHRPDLARAAAMKAGKQSSAINI